MKKLIAENVYYSYQNKHQKTEVLQDVSCEFEEKKCMQSSIPLEVVNQHCCRYLQDWGS
ncbi:MAG: hypothetical protein ACK5KR_03135 [Breznakia sp.]